MTPVHQTRFGEDGNCWQACIASLLALPLEDVPDFCNEPYNGRDPGAYFQNTQEWLRDRGLMLVWIPGTAAKCVRPVGWHMRGGKSPRGLQHVVVGRDDTVEHDPHPSGEGLVDIDCFYFVVALDTESDYAGEAAS